MEEKPTAAFILSLLGGIFLLLGATLALVAFIGIIGLVLAILVIVGAVMLNSNPKDHTTWGIIILIFSILGLGPWNLFGAFLIGSILGIVGGVLALAFEPRPPAVATRVVAVPYYSGPPYPAPTAPANWQPPAVPPGNPSSATAGIPPQGQGQALPGLAPGVQPASPRFCANCGTPLVQGTSFCGTCGIKLA